MKQFSAMPSFVQCNAKPRNASGSHDYLSVNGMVNQSMLGLTKNLTGGDVALH